MVGRHGQKRELLLDEAGDFGEYGVFVEERPDGGDGGRSRNEEAPSTLLRFSERIEKKALAALVDVKGGNEGF